MKKNVSGQFVGAQMVTASDGSAFTGTVTVYVTGDAGTQNIGTVGSGVCTHEGNGFHTYAPSQAETNYDHVAFTFIGTGAVPATVQIYTTFPQTGDSYPFAANLPSDPADASVIAAAFAAVPAAVWNEDLEGNSPPYSARELMRLFAAALLGLASGLDTGNPTYRDLDNTKDRIDATTDADGNRSAVTLDPS